MEAVKFDEENGNTVWQDATKKEMQQIIDFKTFEPKGRGAKSLLDIPIFQFTCVLMLSLT